METTYIPYKKQKGRKPNKWKVQNFTPGYLSTHYNRVRLSGQNAYEKMCTVPKKAHN